MTTRRSEPLMGRRSAEPLRRERTPSATLLEPLAAPPKRRSPLPSLFQLAFGEPLPPDYYLG